MSLNECLVISLGLTPYEEAWHLQNELAARIAVGDHPPALLLLEHPHTYTFGKRGQAKNLLWNETMLRERGISVHWVDRGGDVTYHGPGQLVGYPLLPLSCAGLLGHSTGDSPRIPHADYVGYIRKLEDMLILALELMGIKGQRVTGLTGVWVQPGKLNSDEASNTHSAKMVKIAAIGVKVDARGITRHGFALNVNPDMTYWQGIIACGIENSGTTSLAMLLTEPPTIEQTAAFITQAFSQVFGYELIIPVQTKHTPQN